MEYFREHTRYFIDKLTNAMVKILKNTICVGAQFCAHQNRCQVQELQTEALY